MLDVALFMSNAARLKSVLEQGPSSQYYTTLIALISISLLLQVVVGVLLVVIGKESRPESGFLHLRPLVVGPALASPVKLRSHLLTKPSLSTPEPAERVPLSRLLISQGWALPGSFFHLLYRKRAFLLRRCFCSQFPFYEITT